jgi:hypothetical protein
MKQLEKGMILHGLMWMMQSVLLVHFKVATSQEEPDMSLFIQGIVKLLLHRRRVMEEEEQGNEGNEQDDEEYMPNDDEVDDFDESPHSSPTQAGAGSEENAMDDLDLGDI